MLTIVGQRSKEYMMDKAEFQSTVSVSNAMKTDGRKYAQTKSVVFLPDEEEDKLYCYMRCGDSIDELTEEDVDEFLAKQYDTFDDWSTNLFNIYQLEFATDPTKWMDSYCNCPAFASSFMCKHIVCVAYKLNILKRPTNDQLVANTKRGRPKNATKGLSRD